MGEKRIPIHSGFWQYGFCTTYTLRTTGETNSWARYYMRSGDANGSLHQSWFMGTSRDFNGDQFYLVDESAGQMRMAISTTGMVGINNTNPQSGLDIRGTGFQVQQRITDNTSGNSLVLQAGAGANTKVTGYNYGSFTAVPLYLSTDGANTVMNSGGGHVLQPGAGFGLPKAMVYVLGSATISRCYNGVTGAATAGCGFSVTKTNDHYDVNFGFNVAQRFYSLTLTDQGSFLTGNFQQLASKVYRHASNDNVLRVAIYYSNLNFSEWGLQASDFILIAY